MENDLCLILDFGGGQSRDLARRIRLSGVYCEIVPANTPLSSIVERAPRCLILAGEGSLRPDDALAASDLPMLALGRAAEAVLLLGGGQVAPAGARERVEEIAFEPIPMLQGVENGERLLAGTGVWTLPEDWQAIATNARGEVVGFASPQEKRYGLAFYPESNDPDGLAILSGFLKEEAGCLGNWTLERFREETVARLREMAGTQKVLCLVSGGVDSTVCASLLLEALGEQLVCLHVDTGLNRGDEEDLLRRCFGRSLASFRSVDAHDRFLEALRGVEEPDRKREVVERTLFEVVQEEAGRLYGVGAVAIGSTYTDRMDGMCMPPVDASTEDAFVIWRPVETLLKDEVRDLGRLLGIEEEIVSARSFPAPGLALRCLGEVTERKLRLLRASERIFEEEMDNAGLSRKTGQFFVILSDIRTRDFREEGATGYMAILRAVNRVGTQGASVCRLPYDLLERVTLRVTEEVRGVNRLVYDITGQPPAGVEWI